MSEINSINPNELMHYGVLGMKWGVRRYQKKDGSLTRLGERRYTKEMKKYDKEKQVLKNKIKTSNRLAKLDKKRQEVEDLKKKADGTDSATSKKVKRGINDMSNEDLQKAVNRMRLEQDYQRLSAAQVEKGKSFVDSLKEVAVPALKSSAQTQLTKLLNKKLGEALGTEAVDELTSLKNDVTKLRLTKQKQDYEKELSINNKSTSDNTERKRYKHAR